MPVHAGQFADFEYSDGDTVLLIQMKGVRSYITEDASFGDYEGPIGTPGQHEFIIIDSVESATKKIIFKRNISNLTFNAEGGIQIVTVPTYNEAIVNSTLTCTPWDSTKKTGGVIVAIINRTIRLNADINVNGTGFKGGNTTIGISLCREIPGMAKYAFTATSDSGGFKGESPASRGLLTPLIRPPLYPKYAKGPGANFTGGGGSQGKFSGAGGGGNYGAGGTGGQEASGCITQFPGGSGGKALNAFLVTQKAMFLGSGGGGPTYTSGATTSPGGNGGGMVILVCDTLIGNNKNIFAEGAVPAITASGLAGAGGGGGGGTVALYMMNYSNVSISVKGGHGGANLNLYGDGGGGGGGLITTNNPTSSGTINRFINGGLKGVRPAGGTRAIDGSAGTSLTTWVPRLNGFLFNSIRSSVTNNQIDSICSNVVPKPITGTLPVGGSGSYTYTWQKSYNLTGLPSLIGGAVLKDFTPAATEATTFWIRRIVRDDVSTLTDTSKWVQIIVQPAITGNLIGKDTTICINQDPLNLIPLNLGPSNGNGRYQYQWIQNLDNINWPTSANATGTSNIASYNPPALTNTTFYQRKVTSGRCINYSSTVKITVLPVVTGNTMLSADTIICEGSLFNKLRTSVPTGGETGNYDFQWQDSTTAGIWQSTSAADIIATYVPDTSKFDIKEQIYFRRIVYSGPDSVCVNKSAPVQLTRWHKLENNIISADQTICSGATPLNLTGVQPAQGDHVNYSYEWQDSSKATTWTTRQTFLTNAPWGPPALTDTTWYRRVVKSSTCANTSNRIVVKVHDPITNNLIVADTTICNGADPKKLRGKQPAGGNWIFGYQWYSSTDNFSTNNVSIGIPGTSINYDPAALNSTRSYRREVISGMCKTLSNIINITVLPSITANTITPDKPEVCFNTTPNQISGSPLTGGAGGTPVWMWQDSTNGSAWTNIGGSTRDYTHLSGLTEQTWYRRIIRSGPFSCCIDTSAVAVIDTLKLPTATITSVIDTTICSGSVVKLRMNLTGAKNWTLVYNENATPVTENSISSGKYIISRIPSVGSSMGTFNYSLASLIDNNGCAAVATGLSGTRKANVWRVPVTQAGPDASVCGPVYALAAVPSDGTGTWIFPPQVLSGNPALYNTQIAIDSSYTTANVSYKFYWQELNGICLSKDSVIITFDNRIDPIDAGTGGDVMSFDNATMVNATDLKPFETGLWSVVEGNGDFEFPDKDSTYITNISTGTNTFKWTVINGICRLEDLITFVVSSPEIPELISPNNDNVNDILKITGLDFVTQTIDLTILNGAGTVVFSTSNKNGNDEWVDWDGKNSKGIEFPEGTYYYLLKVSSGKVSGRVSKRSGFIILKRQ
jgi:gliding motility-associated-like protein